MCSILAYLFFVVYYMLFEHSLIVFRLFQWLCFNLYCKIAHEKNVDGLVSLLLANTYVFDTRYRVHGLEKLPIGISSIVAIYHQSLYDIAIIGWLMRKALPKLFNQIDLVKGSPRVLFSRNHCGVVLVKIITRTLFICRRRMDEYMETFNRAKVILPEAVRGLKGETGASAGYGLQNQVANMHLQFM